MSQQWRGPGTPRFADERKPIIERPAPIKDSAWDEFCYCGEQHYQPEDVDPKYWRAGDHPWPPLDDPEAVND